MLHQRARAIPITAAGVAPTLVQFSNDRNKAGFIATFTFSQATVAGSTLLYCTTETTGNNNRDVVNVTDNQGQTWTKRIRVEDPGDFYQHTLHIWEYIGTAAGVTTVDVQWTHSSTADRGAIYEVTPCTFEDIGTNLFVTNQSEIIHTPGGLSSAGPAFGITANTTNASSNRSAPTGWTDTFLDDLRQTMYREEPVRFVNETATVQQGTSRQYISLIAFYS